MHIYDLSSIKIQSRKKLPIIYSHNFSHYLNDKKDRNSFVMWRNIFKL